jgi:hypothetical protein
MSIIAFDGTTIAADKAICEGMLLSYKGKKLFKHGNMIIGFAGNVARSLIIKDWILSGADPNKFPTVTDKDDLCSICVLTRIKDGQNSDTGKLTLLFYENSPAPIVNESPYIAIGSGAAVAMGAMAAGKTAVEAVKIAIKHNPGCGFGYEAYTL